MMVIEFTAELKAFLSLFHDCKQMLSCSLPQPGAQGQRLNMSSWPNAPCSRRFAQFFSFLRINQRPYADATNKVIKPGGG